MSYEPGAYIDLRYLNDKPKKGGDFSAQFDDVENDNLFDPGTRFVFGSPLKIFIPA